jgi:hypothetical protein
VSELDDLMIARVARELRKPERIDPSFDRRVMAEIRAGRAPGKARWAAWEWLVRPRSFQLSPLGGLAMAGAAAAVMLVAVSQTSDDRQPDTVQPVANVEQIAPATPGNQEQSVQFVFRAPSAQRVALVGDFNDWDSSATPLRQAAGGLWTVTVPLTAGRYTYTFVVDGERWMADPSAPPAPPDDSGRPGSVVTIGESAS